MVYGMVLDHPTKKEGKWKANGSLCGTNPQLMWSQNKSKRSNVTSAEGHETWF